MSVAEAAHLRLDYAVDNAISNASLNGRAIGTGRGASFQRCGGEATLSVPQVCYIYKYLFIYMYIYIYVWFCSFIQFYQSLVSSNNKKGR